MSNKAYVWFSGVSSILILIFAVLFWGPLEQEKPDTSAEQLGENPVEMKKARSEYFFRLLRDPATNSIPDNIRSRELEYSRQLPSRDGRTLRKSAQATQQAKDITWQSAGPNKLGGRTRALAIDQQNSDIIIAGGISGGIWKSTDGGVNWEMKTDPNQNMSVTNVAQDPTSPDTWYYTSGEFSGNSASDRAFTARYYGTGIYKSINNGDSWSLISSTEDKDTQFSSRFDYISRIKVSPTTGSVFAASNGVGLLRSTDNGSTFPIVKGDLNHHNWSDFDIDSNGNIIAVFSSTFLGNTNPGNEPGIFYSDDDGDSWIDVTPADFPSGHDRSVIAFAPSNPDIAYVFSRKTSSSTNPDANQGVSFFKIDISDPQNPTAEDRSGNLPNFGGRVGGVNLQGGYNMVVSVKPNDPDFVMIGGTNLFRSFDGFATAPADTDNDGFSDDSEKDEYWIGGYAKANNVSQYSGQHPDQHVIAYDPNDPNRVWTGHDGGLSLTSDITASAVTWEDKDDGYVTGQFYTVDIPDGADDNRILGGTQDNGTPFFRTDSQGAQQTALTDISTGDGSYGFFTNNFIFASSQLGNIRRHTTDNSGNIAVTVYSVQPPNASNQLFVHPYVVDPNDESIMFYPGQTTMWRNTSMDQNNPETNWNSFTAVTGGNGHFISTLEMTTNPSGILYYAASSSQPTGSAPKIYRLENASSSTAPTELSATGAPDGAYVHDLAVNPEDGDELIAVMSNYNIVGLYYSDDGGSSWTAVEGNLTGGTDPGPSVRSATILPTASGTMYLVGTSTGVYSTTSLSGSSTNWTQESAGGSQGSIGYSVTEYITSRPSDGTIAVGTHGRGIFLGKAPTAPVNLTLNVGNDWQLVGSPMASTSEVQLDNNLTIFGFSGTYKSASSLESQKGYWVKSRSGSQINFSGQENTSATITLEEGWNIIGGITDTVSTSNISDPNGIRSSTPVQEYVNGSYQDASNIKTGQGYWIHADQAGDIEISTSSSSSKEQMAGVTHSVDRITFSSGLAEQRFFVAGESVDSNTMDKFRMPPKAPEPVLDVRTSDGFRLAQDESTELKLTARSFPVSVSVSQGASSNYLLKGVTGQDTVFHELRAGNEAEIQQPHQKYLLESLTDAGQITQHDLLPNYPNPFNPTTKIRYQIASQANVSVEVYNILGQKVRTLVNREQTTGSYTVQFDGRNLSSGMYFIHLKAGNTAKVQKMTLIK